MVGCCVGVPLFTSFGGEGGGGGAEVNSRDYYFFFNTNSHASTPSPRTSNPTGGRLERKAASKQSIYGVAYLFYRCIHLVIHRRFMIQRGHEHTRTGN